LSGFGLGMTRDVIDIGAHFKGKQY
jgi:hypothetical protein